MRLYERAQWFVTAKDIDYEFASRSKGILQSVVANLIDSLEEKHRPASCLDAKEHPKRFSALLANWPFEERVGQTYGR